MSTLSQLRIEPDKQVVSLTFNDAQAKQNLGALLRDAIETPREYPPLGATVFPGDRIAIASQGEQAIVCPVVLELAVFLREQGVRGEDVCIVLAPSHADAEKELRECLEQREMSGFEVYVHDPANDDQLAYLAASEEGAPIVFSRKLLDADVVIPIRDAAPLSTTDWDRELFPVFSDVETQRRFRQSIAEATDEQWKNRAKWIAEANHWLGVSFEIFVVPGESNSVREIVAGSRQPALTAAREHLDRVWLRELDEAVDLILATPRANEAPIGYDELVRCITQLQPCVADHGTIVLLGSYLSVSEDEELATESESDEEELEDRRSDIRTSDDEATETPPEELVEDLDQALKETWDDPFARTNSDESQQARTELLEHTLDRIRVVVIGDGFDESVEELGIGIAEKMESVQRLIDRAPNCLVVEDALRCRLRVKEAIQ